MVMTVNLAFDKFVSTSAGIATLFVLVLLCLYALYNSSQHNGKLRFNQQNGKKILAECRDEINDLMYACLLKHDNQGGKVRVTHSQAQDYVFSNKELLYDAKQAMGNYGSMPQGKWLEAYKKQENRHFDSDKDALVQFLMRNADSEVKYWYVTYDGKYYHWYDLDGAVKKLGFHMNPHVRAICDAAQMLNLHFTLETSKVFSWRHVGKTSSQTLANCHKGKTTKDVNLDELIVYNDQQATLIRLVDMKPVAAQVYPDVKTAKLADDPIPFAALFSNAVSQVMKMQKKSRDRGKANVIDLNEKK